MTLSKDDILNCDDLKREEVEAWGGIVLVQELNGADRDEFEASRFEQNGPGLKLNLRNTTARLCAMSLVNADGSRMFTLDEVEKLAKKSGKTLDRVADVAMRLSGLGKYEAALGKD